MIAKATVILAGGLLAMCALRRASAAARALLLTATFVALLVLPIAVAVTPSRLVRIPAPADRSRTPAMPAGSSLER